MACGRFALERLRSYRMPRGRHGLAEWCGTHAALSRPRRQRPSSRFGYGLHNGLRDPRRGRSSPPTKIAVSRWSSASEILIRAGSGVLTITKPRFLRLLEKRSQRRRRYGFDPPLACEKDAWRRCPGGLRKVRPCFREERRGGATLTISELRRAPARSRRSDRPRCTAGSARVIPYQRIMAISSIRKITYEPRISCGHRRILCAACQL